MLGAFGILAGGGGLMASNGQVAPSTAQSNLPDQPKDVDLVAWAAQTQLALDEVNRQLDIAAEVRELWLRHPLSGVGGPQPDEVIELQARTAELEQQRSTLQTELVAYERLGSTGKDLAAAQGDLTALERAIQAAGPEQQALRGQLLAQREAAAHLVEAKQSELLSLGARLEFRQDHLVVEGRDDLESIASVTCG